MHEKIRVCREKNHGSLSIALARIKIMSYIIHVADARRRGASRSHKRKPHKMPISRKQAVSLAALAAASKPTNEQPSADAKPSAKPTRAAKPQRKPAAAPTFEPLTLADHNNNRQHAFVARVAAAAGVSVTAKQQKTLRGKLRDALGGAGSWQRYAVDVNVARFGKLLRVGRYAIEALSAEQRKSLIAEIRAAVDAPKPSSDKPRAAKPSRKRTSADA